MAALAGLLLALASYAPPPAAAQPRPPGPPNVLFIAVDDLNDWIGPLGGHPDVHTPNLDRLARRGLVFRHAYTASPSCNPSRAALLTGVRPSTSGVYGNRQPWRRALPDAVTLPQHFMRHRYHVAGGGKIYHGRFPDPASWHEYFPQPEDPKPRPEVASSPRSRSGGIVWGELEVAEEQMADHRVASWAADYLRRSPDRPFFLAVGIYRPHMPWSVPRRYYDLYPPDRITLPTVLEDDLGDIPQAGVAMAKPAGDHATMLATGNWRRAVQAYLASITFADAQIGRVLDALDASPHRDNTIVVLWGDHGWHLGEKQHWRKFALWEEATRTPLIWAVPGVTRPGSVSDRTVDLMSLYPTLAELAGLPAPAQNEGVSITRLLRDPDAEWHRPALTTFERGNHAVRSERWRYIRYADGSEELYDHRADPLEWRNLAADPALAEVRAELARWLPSVNAPDAPAGGEGDG